MTITVNNNRIDYAGNGATTVFAYDFKILVDSEIKVYLDGVLKTISTHYTVSGVGVAAGGNVTFLTAPGSGVVVTLIGEVPLSQATDYLIGSKFPAETHEAALDKLTRITQQLDRRLRDTLTLNTQSLFFDLKLPDPVSQSLLRWKTDLTGLENVAASAITVFNTALLTTEGDMVIGGTGGVATRLPIGAAGQQLEVVAGRPAWAASLKTIIDAKGDLLVGSAADTLVRRPVGANGTVLTADSAEADGVKWGSAGIPASIVDAKGDILAATAADTVARVAVGANRTILEADSAATPGVAWVARALGLKSMQVFTASGTWTRPTGIRKVLIEVVGGGGGGGSTQATADQFGAGGGGGGFAMKLLDVSAIASSTITIGALGAGGAAGSNNGAAGGNSSWADGTNTLTGNGGGGGAFAAGGAAGGAGGTGTGGDVNIAGGIGGPGQSPTAANAVGPNQGGVSQRSSGTTPTSLNNVGNAAAGFGGGGSGAANAGATARAGGNGSAGIIIVYEYE